MDNGYKKGHLKEIYIFWPLTHLKFFVLTFFFNNVIIIIIIYYIFWQI